MIRDVAGPAPDYSNEVWDYPFIVERVKRQFKQYGIRLGQRKYKKRCAAIEIEIMEDWGLWFII